MHMHEYWIREMLHIWFHELGQRKYNMLDVHELKQMGIQMKYMFFQIIKCMSD